MTDNLPIMGPIGGTVSPYGSPANEDSEDYWYEQRYEDALLAELGEEEYLKMQKDPMTWNADRIKTAKALEASKREQSRQWHEEAMETPGEYMIRTNRELRERAIAEEDAAKSKATIHAYPYFQSEGITMKELRTEMKENAIEKYSEKPVAPKPSQVHFKIKVDTTKLVESTKAASKAIKHLGKAAQKTREAFEKAFPEHLTDRPFHTPEMIALRESLAKNQ